MGELEGRAHNLLRLLQLPPNPFVDPLHSGDGSRNHNSRLGTMRIAHCLSPVLPPEAEFERLVSDNRPNTIERKGVINSSSQPLPLSENRRWAHGLMLQDHPPPPPPDEPMIIVTGIWAPYWPGGTTNTGGMHPPLQDTGTDGTG
jgi:hypothetical protein